MSRLDPRLNSFQRMGNGAPERGSHLQRSCSHRASAARTYSSPERTWLIAALSPQHPRQLQAGMSRPRPDLAFQGSGTRTSTFPNLTAGWMGLQWGSGCPTVFLGVQRFPETSPHSPAAPGLDLSKGMLLHVPEWSPGSPEGRECREEGRGAGVGRGLG